MALLENIAVLIDADNAMVGAMEAILNRISLEGRISLKRAYGNWTKESLSSWNGVIKKLAIHPIHQIDFVHGKNATDIAVVIDAMDLLHSGLYDGFAIVSNDSDFTPLAMRLREAGVRVIGCGGSSAPESLIHACDQYFSFSSKGKSSGKATEKKSAEKTPAREKKDPSELHALLKDAFEHYQREDGYAPLSLAGSFLDRAMSDFDIRDYGSSRLASFVEKNTDMYETRIEGEGFTKVIMYRCKF